MGWWLATERTVQTEGVISRFDPAYWTVNFPRQVMAARADSCMTCPSWPVSVTLPRPG